MTKQQVSHDDHVVIIRLVDKRHLSAEYTDNFDTAPIVKSMDEVPQELKDQLVQVFYRMGKFLRGLT